MDNCSMHVLQCYLPCHHRKNMCGRSRATCTYNIQNMHTNTYAKAHADAIYCKGWGRLLAAPCDQWYWRVYWHMYGYLYYHICMYHVTLSSFEYKNKKRVPKSPYDQQIIKFRFQEALHTPEHLRYGEDK